MRARFPAPSRRLGDYQFLHFLVVGCGNTLFGYSLYLFGLAMRLSPELALLLTTCVGALFNYATTARFVFKHRTLSRLPLFGAAYALVYFVNSSGIRLLLSGGFTAALAQAVLAPAMAVLSFLLFRFLVFRPIAPSRLVTDRASVAPPLACGPHPMSVPPGNRT